MSGVVVGIGAVVGAVIGGGSSLYAQKRQNKSLIKSFKKQMQYMRLNYNYNQAQLDLQEKSMYDVALGELFNLSTNAIQNNASVTAALADSGLAGRNSKKVQQVTEGQVERQNTALKEAYEGEYYDIQSKKNALYIQTQVAMEQARDNVNSNMIGGFPAFMQFLDSSVKGAAMGASMAGMGAAAAGATTSSSVGAGAGGSWIGRFNTLYTKEYSPYFKMFGSMQESFSGLSNNVRRGGYYY